VPADTIAHYLNSISSKLGLDRVREEEITKELGTHLEDAVREHRIKGLRVQPKISSLFRASRRPSGKA
jgi:hypothetical protein